MSRAGGKKVFLAFSHKYDGHVTCYFFPIHMSYVLVYRVGICNDILMWICEISNRLEG